MHISKLTIKGFRSFDNNGTEFSISGPLISFIGLNSSGKTAALDAFRKLFGNTIAEREISRQDFHIAFGEIPNKITEKKLLIEAKVNFNDLGSKAIPHYFSHMVIDTQGSDPYLRIRLESKWNHSEINQEGEIDSKIFFITVSEGEEENDDCKYPVPNYLRSLIQVLYVPAIRRPSEQIKYASGTILYRVLRKIRFDEKFKAEFEKKIEDINLLFRNMKEFSAIQESLSGFWGKFHKDERYKESAIMFGGSDLESILKKLEVSFGPTDIGIEYKIDDLGEGYRSLFYFTMVCSLLEIEEKFAKINKNSALENPLLTILAVEEPENHIAPQLLGRVISVLKSISNQKNTQVAITSHTPAIIKRVDPESIFHFRIDNKYKTKVNKISLPQERDEAYKYVKEAVQNYPELYFAKLVIIGEGDSEEILFVKLMNVLETDFDDNIITFAPLGHRFVNHIWKLLNDLDIPYITLLDLDLERYGGGWGRIKYAIKQLLEIGVPKKELLELKGGKILSDEELDEMHTWPTSPNDIKTMKGWINSLEKHSVYYSSPLDLDFLMLQHYGEYYKRSIPKGGGPRIPDNKKEPKAYDEKLKLGIQATLKNDNAIGNTYSNEEKELMIWYNYHFLGRGKPITHLQVLSSMSDDDIKGNLPKVFNDIFAKINDHLGIK